MPPRHDHPTRERTLSTPYYQDQAVTIWHGNALALPIPDESVDLIVTSPPYFSLRSYTDGGEHYDGQIGSEATPGEFVDALIAATAEMVRVLKPSGSIWINLGDSYSGKPSSDGSGRRDKAGARGERPNRRSGRDLTREQASWLAGVIDSDGSIGVHINQQPEGRAPSFVPWVRVGQMRPEVVERIGEVVGTGTVTQDGRGVWTWAASAQQARWVLERIHPWLLIKKQQAHAAIEVARHVEERNAKGSWRPLTGEDITYRQRLRDAVMAWNRGEPDDLVVPVPRPISLPVWGGHAREKSLRLIPEEYRLRCVYELGLYARAVVIWAKPNGLPESVTDRVRRSHEDWVHLTKEPRYFSAVDEIRETYSEAQWAGVLTWDQRKGRADAAARYSDQNGHGGTAGMAQSPLGKLPGSVWEIPTQPLTVPAHLGVDHFAAFPMEFPRRIIRGWSPSGICVECGEGRRPVVDKVFTPLATYGTGKSRQRDSSATDGNKRGWNGDGLMGVSSATLTGYACACDAPTAPTRPAVILDPFGGTGTTALVAKALGRIGWHVDLSADYCRLAQWRVTDPGELARAMQVEKPPPAPEDMDSLLDLLEGGAA